MLKSLRSKYCFVCFKMHKYNIIFLQFLKSVAVEDLLCYRLFIIIRNINGFTELLKFGCATHQSLNTSWQSPTRRQIYRLYVGTLNENFTNSFHRNRWSTEIQMTAKEMVFKCLTGVIRILTILGIQHPFLQVLWVHCRQASVHWPMPSLILLNYVTTLMLSTPNQICEQNF